jgi:hypothetical protein
MITQVKVAAFKNLYCNENSIISGLLRNSLPKFFIEPILDVGSGLGDIAALAFPDKEVIHLDILDYSDYPLPDAHRRMIGDFFDFVPAVPLRIRTMLFCHVLQFLDEDLERLNDKVRKTSPSYVITVTNCNDSYMKKILTWVEANFKVANPEVELNDFPEGYILDCEIPFAATLQCEDHSMLADQVIYLMDASPSATERDHLEERLRQDLFAPMIHINQTIKVYRKYE